MIDIKNYNDDNVFNKILKNEIPCKKVFEDDHVLAFHDINPMAPIHVVVIPKQKLCSLDQLSTKGSSKVIIQLIKSIKVIVDCLKIQNGYRLICNNGFDAGQEVPHVHFHILAGKKLGKII